MNEEDSNEEKGQEDTFIKSLPEHLQEVCRKHGAKIILFCLNRMTLIQAGQEILHSSRAEKIQDRAMKVLAAGDQIAQMVVADQGWTVKQIEEAVRGLEEAVRQPRIVRVNEQLH